MKFLGLILTVTHESADFDTFHSINDRRNRIFY